MAQAVPSWLSTSPESSALMPMASSLTSSRLDLEAFALEESRAWPPYRRSRHRPWERSARDARPWASCAGAGPEALASQKLPLPEARAAAATGRRHEPRFGPVVVARANDHLSKVPSKITSGDHRISAFAARKRGSVRSLQQRKAAQ